LLTLGGVSGSRPARGKSCSSEQRRIAIAYDNARAVMSTASMIRSIRRHAPLDRHKSATAAADAAGDGQEVIRTSTRGEGQPRSPMPHRVLQHTGGRRE
jgi:hypothetical protein